MSLFICDHCKSSKTSDNLSKTLTTKASKPPTTNKQPWTNHGFTEPVLKKKKQQTSKTPQPTH